MDVSHTASALVRLLLVVFSLQAGSTALAAECGPLKQADAINTVPIANGLQLVPVVMVGQPKKLLLGTAAGISMITRQAVAELGLRTSSTDGRVRLLSRNGSASASYATVPTLTIGGMQGKNVDLMVTSDQQSGGNQQPTIDGGLAMDMLGAYDVEMDFAQHKLNLFLVDHCPGKVVYWPAQTIAVVPYAPSRQGHSLDTQITVPVTLDGKRFVATIATESQRSTMSAATAKYAFQITADSPGSVAMGSMDGDPAHMVFGTVLGSLTFEGVSVRNPRFVVLPDLIGSKDPYNVHQTGSNIRRADDDMTPAVTIGMDVLRNLRVYVATRERKLYITPNAPPASPAEN